MVYLVSNKVDDLVSWFVDYQENGAGLQGGGGGLQSGDYRNGKALPVSVLDFYNYMTIT